MSGIIRGCTIHRTQRQRSTAACRLDRADLFRRAAGSASELTTALRIGRARGCTTPAELEAVDAVLDRVRAMRWRLTHGVAGRCPGEAGLGAARRDPRVSSGQLGRLLAIDSKPGPGWRWCSAVSRQAPRRHCRAFQVIGGSISAH
jgi:hypothetical protein